MKEITTRIMELKLKSGWTVSDFVSFLECKDENEFWKTFEIAFSDKAKADYRRKLKQNQKNREKDVLKNSKRQSGKKIIMSVQHPEKQEETATVKNVETEENVLQEKKQNNDEEILLEMRVKEDKLQKEICDIEASKCSLQLLKKEVRVNLQEKKQGLINLQSQIRKIGQEVEECISKMQEISCSIELMNTEMAEKKEEILTLRKEIKEREKIVVLVYESGEVVVEGFGTNEFVIDEIWESIFQRLRDDELVEDLTNRQIKLLSKVIAFINTVKNYEVIFEVEELQEVFEKIPNKGLKFFPVTC